MHESGLDVVAKAPTLWIGAMEITADEAQSELLRQLRGCIRIADGAKQVTIGSTAIAR